MTACEGGRRGGGGGGGGEPPETALAAGITLSEVALYQALKVPLMKDGAMASGTVPVVAGRAALVRVFVTPAAGYMPREVSYRLELSGGSTLEVKKTITAASTEANLDSTVNFEVPGERIAGGTTWRVSANEVAPGLKHDGPTDGAAWPPTDPLPLATQDTGEALHIKIIPVRYDADGSGRLPDVSDAQLQRYRDLFYALYPAREVEITVGDQFPWASTVSPNGSGWSQLLQAILQRRQADRVPDNVYYYGAFCPAASLGQFCGGGCVLGLSSGSPNPRDDFVRGSIGLGWGGSGGNETVETAVHEVGHAHGREHAPCMLFGQPSDPGYPHPGGQIGVWGYDLVKKRLIDPSGPERDMMGYCKPLWISDYTYNALVDRVAAVNARAKIASTPPTTYRMHTVSDDALTPGLTVTLTHRPGGEPREVDLLDEAGRPTGARATGWYYPFDHLPGGILLLAEEGAPLRARLR